MKKLLVTLFFIMILSTSIYAQDFGILMALNPFTDPERFVAMKVTEKLFEPEIDSISSAIKNITLLQDKMKVVSNDSLSNNNVIIINTLITKNEKKIHDALQRCSQYVNYTDNRKKFKFD